VFRQLPDLGAVGEQCDASRPPSSIPGSRSTESEDSSGDDRSGNGRVAQVGSRRPLQGAGEVEPGSAPIRSGPRQRPP
jgi:hypothetical protein